MATELTAELRRLVAKATPGPWRLDPEGRGTRVTGSPPDAYGGPLVTLSRHIAPGRASRSDARLIVAMRNALPELLRAAEELERMATNERMMMARLSGYDECPEDPVAAVMHVADCFDAMTGACVHQVQESKRLRAQRDALVAAASSAVNGVVIVRDDCDRDVLVANPDKIEALRAAIRAAKENQ